MESRTKNCSGSKQPPAWPSLHAPDEPLRRARRRFFDDGLRPAVGVPELVLQSWERCLRAGRRPQELPEFQPVSRSRVSYVTARDHALLRAARTPFDELQAAVARTRCKVLLTDRHGVLLRVTPPAAGDGAVTHGACRVGVDLGEAQIGTVAPSLAAQAGQACSVTGAEHFHDALQQMRCVAAPIRNRHGAVAGVLDLSIEDQDFGFDAQLLVQSFAMTIENRLRIAQTREHLLLRLHTAPGGVGSAWAGLVAVDGQGRIGWLSPVAAALLGVSAALAPGADAEALLGCSQAQLQACTVGAAPRPLLLPSGLSLWMTVSERALGVPASGADDDEPPPSLDFGPGVLAATAAAHAPDDDADEAVALLRSPGEPTLAHASRQLIERVLAECGGNVSQAARRLGVSRGLLYRRLARYRPGPGAPPG